MKLCNDCKNLGKKQQCIIYGKGSNYAEQCKDYKKKKPQTRADKIRKMSDEELSVLLADTANDCYRCRMGAKCDVRRNGKECKDVYLDWLKEEVG